MGAHLRHLHHLPLLQDMALQDTNLHVEACGALQKIILSLRLGSLRAQQHGS
jgi:hypothetical protein